MSVRGFPCFGACQVAPLINFGILSPYTFCDAFFPSPPLPPLEPTALLNKLGTSLGLSLLSRYFIKMQFEVQKQNIPGHPHHLKS